MRKELYLELKEGIKDLDNVYKDFLLYYSKNWLNTYSVYFEAVEGEGRYVRTNNVCEQYNRRMKQKIGIKHPRLAILIKALLEEEDSW